MERNRNGFTLVELLAVIVILGIIMLIAVPNVVGVIDNNRKETYLSDAKKMVTMAEYATRTNTSILMPNNGEVTVLRLSYINNGDLTKDPEGNNYDTYRSYIAIKKGTDGFDEYYVNLVGGTTEKNRGINLTKVDDLNGDNRFKMVVKNFTIRSSNDEIKNALSVSTVHEYQ